MEKYRIDPGLGWAKDLHFKLTPGLAFLGRLFAMGPKPSLRKYKDRLLVKAAKIPVKGGKISVYAFIPKGLTGKLPCLFYIHGGGFAFDMQPHQYRNAAEYALGTESVVVMPRYRLTPKVSHPTLFEDCVAAWKWMKENADSLSIDLQRVGIGGDSAGGYLAARLTNKVVEEGFPLRYQMLLYPVIDVLMRTPSMKAYTDTPMWNAKNNVIMWDWYYRDAPREESLLDIELPKNLPPTYLETCEFDCLHDEGLLYAKKLLGNGVRLTLNETLGTVHGFDISDSPLSEEALQKRIAFLKAAS